MLRAGALLYVMGLTLVIGLLSSFFILSAYYWQVINIGYDNIERITVNCESGINLLLSKQNIVGINEKKTIDLYGDNKDSVELERKLWGLFEIVTCKAHYKRNSISKAALVGFYNQRDVALYVSGNDRPLSVCGNTRIKGNCFLRQTDVRRAYIEGQSFSGIKLIDGTIKKSERRIPELNKEALNRSIDFLENAREDSLISWEEITVGNNTLINSFDKKTIRVTALNTIRIKNRNFTGNIIIHSSKEIRVDKSAILKDIILIAPKIFIEDSCQFILQAFASDSLVVGKNCKLNYPSNIGILSNDNTSAASFVSIGEKSELSGSAIIYTESNSQNVSQIKISKDALVKGLVYSNGVADVQGSIFGSLYCNGILLTTLSSVYENHLLNSTIDVTKLSRYFISTGVFEQSDNKKIIKWIN